MCGDPPNVIIGTSLGYTFGDFIGNTGIIAGISLVVTVIYFVLVSRRELVSKTVNYEELSDDLDPNAVITDKKAFVISIWIFLVTALLLVTHAQTGFTVALIGAFAAVSTIVLAGERP